MFSIIDKKLFPDSVHLVEIANGNIVFPIFKNGSSTVNAIKNKDVHFTEIDELQVIDVFIRDPWERFLSGVNTYISCNNLDYNTTAKIINDVGFLNLHFAPQLFWIINLQRFVKSKIRINNLSDLKKYTSLHKHKSQTDNQIVHLSKLFEHNQQLKYYIELDLVLYENFMNCVTDFSCIHKTLTTNYNELYTDTIVYSREILNVLS